MVTLFRYIIVKLSEIIVALFGRPYFTGLLKVSTNPQLRESWVQLKIVNAHKKHITQRDRRLVVDLLINTTHNTQLAASRLGAIVVQLDINRPAIKLLFIFCIKCTFYS